MIQAQPKIPTLFPNEAKRISAASFALGIACLSNTFFMFASKSFLAFETPPPMTAVTLELHFSFQLGAMQVDYAFQIVVRKLFHVLRDRIANHFFKISLF